MKIEHHRLVDEAVVYRDSPNRGGVLRPRLLLLHYTAGRSAESAVATLCNPASKASAHLVIARDGHIYQLLPFDVVAWHAGVSQWMGLSGLNQHAIGIELDNAGQLRRVGQGYVSWFGKVYSENEVLLAEHQHGGGVMPWHTYTEVQIERVREVAELLVSHYALEDVRGHDDVARGRKLDPGPAFPMASVRSRALGRSEDQPARYIVTADSLPVRQGPGFQFAPAAAPLRKGAVLLLVEPGDRWSHVEAEAQSDVEGWVNNRFITPWAAPLPG